MLLDYKMVPIFGTRCIRLYGNNQQKVSFRIYKTLPFLVIPFHATHSSSPNVRTSAVFILCVSLDDLTSVPNALAHRKPNLILAPIMVGSEFYLLISLQISTLISNTDTTQPRFSIKPGTKRFR